MIRTMPGGTERCDQCGFEYDESTATAASGPILAGPQIWPQS